MNISSLAVFCLYQSRWCRHSSRIVVAAHRTQVDDFIAFERMVSAWSWVDRVELLLVEDGPALQHCGDATLVILADASPSAAVDFPAGAPVVIPRPPMPNDVHFGFFQEFEFHDYELGGLNEWREGAKTSFSPYILQTLSAAHVHRMLPGTAWVDIQTQLRKIKPNGRISCLDIGCGPISKLRAAALSGMLEIVGVDPLNDLYTSLIARHGYDRLPHIRPDVCINGFVEEFEFDGKTFDFIFSCNALDHTQDIEKSILKIVQLLNKHGVALIKVYTKEGERQNYSRLHKYNIWAEKNDILFNSLYTKPASIRSISDQIEIGKIYLAGADEIVFTIQRGT